MPKKWYNLFITVDPAGGPETAESGGQSDGSRTPSAARTVAEIAATIEGPRIEATGFAGSAPASFEELYDAAEIPHPAHGYTIFKIAEMLQSDYIKNLPAGVKKSSILVALEAAGVKVQEIIEDAVKRDRALDTFEQVQQKALEQMEAAKAQENRRIEEEMERIVAEHRARVQANNDEVAKSKEKFYGWRLLKQQEEQKISDAVSYFVTENPISTAPPQAPPSKPK